MARFGVRELAPAFSTADSSAVGSPRRVAASKSGVESPPSKNAASDRRGEKCGLISYDLRDWRRWLGERLREGNWRELKTKLNTGRLSAGEA